MKHYIRDYMTMLKVERNLAQNSLESYERDLLQYHDFLESELKLQRKTTASDIPASLADTSSASEESERDKWLENFAKFTRLF